MLSLTYSAICATMKYGCLLRIYPYKWDSKNKRLVTQKSKFLNFIYKYLELCLALTVAFISLRLFQTLGKVVPIQIRAMHTAWFIAFWGTFILKLQFDFRREEVKFFTNILLQKLALACQSKFKLIFRTIFRYNNNFIYRTKFSVWPRSTRIRKTCKYLDKPYCSCGIFHHVH